MPQSQAQDSTYQLPTPAGNTGPLTDLSQVVNSKGQTAQRQRFEGYLGGQTSVITSGEGNVLVSGKPGAIRSFLVTTAAAAGQIIFYDNPSAPNGTIIGIIPANAQVTGIPYILDMPALTGIYAVAQGQCAAGTLRFEQ